jgi:hypothetical protein
LRIDRQQAASGSIELFGFEQTSSTSCPPLQTNGLILLADPIDHLCTMMSEKGVQGPIGLCNESNASLLPDDNGHTRELVAGSHRCFGRFENIGRIVCEWSHKGLIDSVGICETQNSDKFGAL